MSLSLSSGVCGSEPKCRGVRSAQPLTLGKRAVGVFLSKPVIFFEKGVLCNKKHYKSGISFREKMQNPIDIGCIADMPEFEF